jgi:hypothetical protein
MLPTAKAGGFWRPDWLSQALGDGYPTTSWASPDIVPEYTDDPLCRPLGRPLVPRGTTRRLA